MKNGFKLSVVIPVAPDELYQAWLSTAGHTRMTGSPARVSRQVGGKFTAWDGYISGRNLELEPGRRIVQAWRAADFPAQAPDSHLEIVLTPAKAGTRLTLTHTQLPTGMAAAYRQGWQDFYFTPLRAYFGA